MKKLILVNGGVKSGKSEFAECLARKFEKVSYIALSENIVNDQLWQKKIYEHKKRRPKHWKTIETTDLLNVLSNENDTLLVDSIGGFVSSNLNISNEDWNSLITSLVSLIKAYKERIIIVCEQVGLGLVSEYEIGNKFMDRMGEVLKEITKQSDENWLTLNGKGIRLDTLFEDI